MRHSSIIGLTSFIPTWGFACSGPGAADYINRADVIGLGLFTGMALIGIFVTFKLVRRGAARWQPVILMGLVMGHPGWWFSARMGDCGRMLEWASYSVSGLMLVFVIFLLRIPHRS